MKKRFTDKVAVIVGGAGGIGGEIVSALLDEGAKVVVGDMDKKALADMKEKFGSNYTGVVTNAVKKEEQEALVRVACDKYGSIDIAINAAGGSKMGLIDEGDISDWEDTIDLCLKGTYLGMKYQIKAMKKSNGGNIVNISSINAVDPAWADSAYNCAKKAVISLTQTAVLENAKYNIRCNAILPGLIDTKMTQGWLAVPEIRKAYMDKIPMKRSGKPHEIANVALFLASEESSYVNASALLVDGGRAAAGYPNIIDALEKDRSLWEV